MPKLPPRPCTAPRCKQMSVSGGRCKQHQQKAWASSEGKTATERGYGHSWRKVRKQALERDQYLCQECLKHGIATLATDVDHIINKAQGGTDELNNLQSLCNPCHKNKTISERNQ